MRKIMLAVSALAAVVAAGALTGVNAAPLGNPAALAGAVEETGILDSVHCRPGWRHHYPREFRRADGCRRGVVVVPGRSRFIFRDGVRVRVGSDRFRSRTTIRSRTITRSRDRDDGDARLRPTRSGSERGTQSGGTSRSGRDSGATTGGGSRDGRGGSGGGREGGGSGFQQSPSGGGGGSATGGGSGGGRSGGGGASGGGGGGGGPEGGR